MATQAIDYDALANQAGAIDSTPAAQPSGPRTAPSTTATPATLSTSSTSTDYAALAAQAGAIDSASAPAQSSTLPTIVSRGNPIVPGPNESFADTMQRAVAAGKQVKPQDTQLTKGDLEQAAGVAAAAPAIGFLGAGGLATLSQALEYLGVGSAAKAAAKPIEAATEQVGTGILDQYGNEIFRDVPAEAKRVAGNILQNPAVQTAMKKVVRSSITQAGIKYLVPAGAAAAAEQAAPHVMHWLMGE